MKPIYAIGNLIEAPETVLAHGCNARGVCGSGVCLSIRNRFPQAYQAYREAFERDGLELGSVIWAQTEGKYIANCITQINYGRGGRYVSYDGLRRAIRTVHDRCIELNEESFAIPLIGAGLGGGNWDEIVGIIDSECSAIQPIVYQLAEQA